ncbi:hypothetical protein C8A01DRAFT_46964 [Parachaetomium inaequale]|uniref:Aminoglycoside phosphotransferase domain-containing protein n=1 Tax=Parachaetomium inaequale TaxID=2588326 RepID=A0AAN6SQS0_9PEZI|nr:hypothetical protein C8A01DRAFT_46964 [Parachaetomium inaequale]
MDFDENLELLAEHRYLQWLDLLQTRQVQIPEWATSFHPQRLSCSIVLPTLYGSYNFGIPVAFSNGEEWFVRFPLRGKTSAEHLDEKVASEVAALKLLRAHTDIPVPEVKAWGLARENKLGVGPFIIEEFIHGERLEPILSNPDDKDSCLLDGKLDDGKVNTIYKQLARFQLQLFNLNFEHIGSLVGGSSRLQPPLTMAANMMACLSGANVLAPLRQELSTTEDYFEHVWNQYWQQFATQRRSCAKDPVADGKANYIFHQVLKTLIKRHVWPEYSKGPFKLHCDDIGPANMLVNNVQELKIVEVVDVEWSYIAPVQLATVPWWILQERPDSWPFDITRRDMFPKYSDKFRRILEEEEALMPAVQGPRLSELVKRSEEDGSMWLHMLVVTTPDWVELAAEVRGRGEVQSLVARKLEENERYWSVVRETRKMVEEVKDGKRTHQDVIDHVEAAYG